MNVLECNNFIDATIEFKFSANIINVTYSKVI